MSFKQWCLFVFSVLWYIPKAVFVIAMKLLTFIVAPIIALPPFVRFAIEKEVTGYPSQFEHKKRAFLVKWLMGFQTHDDCLDAFWYSGKYRSSWLKRYTQEDFDSKWYVRYFNYVAWLWRNPAYQFADWLGWNNLNYKILVHKGDSTLWKTGVTNYSFSIVRNERGGVSFQIEGQWHYKGARCLEYRFGYGFERYEPDNRCMLNIRIIPWRKYEKKEVVKK